MKEWVLTPDRFLSKEELGRLLKRAEELRVLGVSKNRRQPVRDWMIIRLAVLSGLRASEMCSLQITDLYVGYSRSEILVRRGKGDKKRVVKIGPELKKDLRWYLRWKSEQGELHPAAYLIRSQKTERLSTSAIWRRWKKYCPMHRLHDARHTNATLLYQASKDLRLVQKQLGHSRPSVTAVYADVNDEQAREGLRSMERLAKSSIKRSGTNSADPNLSVGGDVDAEAAQADAVVG